jgi:D-alanyl-D-alanine carboxypeptidase
VAIVSRNLYDDDTDEKLNATPIAVDEQYVLDELSSNTEYNLSATNVDGAGRESVRSDSFAFTTPAIGPGDDMSADDMAAIDAIVTQCLAEFTPRPGISIAVNGARGAYAKAYGRADLAAKPLTTDMHMRMGSITKTFTAREILRHMQLGNLTLDDPVSMYVSGLPSDPTIRNMLMMRSGLYDYSIPSAPGVLGMGLNPASAWTRDQALNTVRTQPVQFAPDALFQYNNSNYMLLGIILESMPGETRGIRQILNDAAAAHGLTQTVWRPDVYMFAPFARGYGPNPYKLIPIIGLFVPAVSDQTNSNPEFFGAAGALISTVGDLQTHAEQMRDGDSLDPETLELWRESGESNPVAYTGEGASHYFYGYGSYRLGSWYGHDGSLFGYSSVSMYEPTTGATIAVMENYQTPNLLALTAVWYRIAEYLYPGSATYPGYATGGPFTGGMGATVGALSSAMVGEKTTPGSFSFPADLPATFVPSAP